MFNKEEIKKHLDENKIPYEDFGTYNTDSVDYPLIAEKFEISRQGVRSVLKKSETILIDMEEKLHLASRFSKMLEKSAEIATELENINQNINNNDISSRIHSLINKIKEMAEY